MTGGDGLLNMYFLENNFKSYGSLFREYFSPDFFWPYRNVFAYSDHLLIPGMIYSVLRLALGNAHAFSLLLLIVLVFNYLSLRWSLCRLSSSSNPFLLTVVTCSCVFSPVAINDGLSHIQLLPLFFVGPLILSVASFFAGEAGEWSKAVVLALIFLTLQLFIGIYVYVFTAYVLVLALMVELVLAVFSGNFLGRTHVSPLACWVKNSWPRFLVASLNHLKKTRNLVLLLMGLLVAAGCFHIPYLRTISDFGDRGHLDPSQMPKPLSLINGVDTMMVPSPIDWHFFWGERPVVDGWEQSLFPGYLFIALFIASIGVAVWSISLSRSSSSFEMFFGSDGSRKVFFKWFLLAILCWLGVVQVANLPTLYSFVVHLIPGAKALRVPSRVLPVVIYFTAPFLVLSLSRIRFAFNSGLRNLVGGVSVIAALCFSERSGFGGFDYSSWYKALSSISVELRNKKCSHFFVSALYDSVGRPLHVVERHLLGMHAQQFSGVKTVNGYSGFIVQDGYPYEFEGDDGVKALGWALFQSKSDNVRNKTGEDVYVPCDVRVTSLANPLAFDVRIVSPRMLRYPKAVYRKNGIILMRGNKNELFVGFDSPERFPVFWPVAAGRDGGPELVDIDGYRPSNVYKRGSKLYIVDTPMPGRGKVGSFCRVVDLDQRRLSSVMWSGYRNSPDPSVVCGD
ncbi:hypothetical protein [Synechococcus sp. LTW-R]|uniref:hypothetical protein n=1 Tax=Synechococcus sp. LTW-R TaxID=2751170 RepID=UPI001628C0DB|nr:hypothetical protein [Synechococcus sp. LTW-R]QNG30677.1 hypothetical protein H0O22_06250 [Synechococcus sp. LTW-R]